MESFTVEEFQMHFDELLERVETGESFVIESEYGNVAIVPCGSNCEDLDEIIRIHTEHGDAS